MASAVDVRGLEVAFGGQVVFTDLDFSIGAGELVCLLGPSGCGKSTMLRIFGDLAQQQAGTVMIEGEPASESWHRLAYVFQAARLASWRTALANVVLGMKLRGIRGSRTGLRAAARHYLELVGAGDLADRPAYALSGGEQQRVSLARALAVEPSVLLMDEPFSALDVRTRKRMRQEIVSLWQETGLTVVLVTHDVDEALAVASRIVVFSPKPTEILADIQVDIPHPRSPRSAEFMASHDEIVGLFGDSEAGDEVQG